MSVIWVLLLVASVVVAAVTGRMAALPGAIAESAGRAVSLSIGLVGILALWLGLMKVAEEAGLVRALGKLARPVLRRLFPSVPAESPAMGAMTMNIAANMLGLGNAATPFGIKAMEELERANPDPGTATDAQALFCALNTASIQLIPASVIALRAAAGARQPADILGATLLASTCATVAAIASAWALRRLFRSSPAPGPPRV
jgi:spore maturation protein A